MSDIKRPVGRPRGRATLATITTTIPPRVKRDLLFLTFAMGYQNINDAIKALIDHHLYGVPLPDIDRKRGEEHLAQLEVDADVSA